MLEVILIYNNAIVGLNGFPLHLKEILNPSNPPPFPPKKFTSTLLVVYWCYSCIGTKKYHLN